MSSLPRKPFVGVVGVIVMLALTAAPALAQFDTQYEPGTPEYQRTWDRTDKPVEDGVVSRTWNWGSARTEVMTEEYAESPDGVRQVQYFDKSRMEINDPDAPDEDLWFVTNGLLVVEMVTGMMQVGDTDFEDRSPADVNIVGDPGNEFSPTYADIASWELRDAPADDEGDLITRTLTDEGEATDDPAYESYGVTAAERVTVPGIDRTVASPFWDFMNSSGPVWEDGQNVEDTLFPNPFYAVGFPITEAYWTIAPVGGTDADVLWQCFERRCLTYTPSNEPGWQVEAGNVGQHYWTWRYVQMLRTHQLVYEIGYATHADIVAIRGDGTDVRNLTNNEEVGSYDPAWSPDGSMIAFFQSYNWAVASSADIYVMNADGSNRQLLVSDVEGGGPPAWSPDGTQIAFARDGLLFTINIDGSNERRVGSLAGKVLGAPAWSPDGQWLAFLFEPEDTPTGPPPRPFAVGVIHPDGSGFTELARNEGIMLDHRRPLWSPTGARLVYQNMVEGIDDQLQPVFNRFINVVKIEDLTEWRRNGSDPAWSRDGQYLTYFNDGLYRINTNGSDRIWLSDAGVESAWSHDGKYIAIAGISNPGLRIIAPNGVTIAEIASQGRSPVWRP